MQSKIKNEINKILEKVISYRRHFHKNPELSFKEFKTTEFIINKLNELSIRFDRPLETGVVGYVGKGDRCIALRADIDALPIEEENEFDYKSTNPGVMHACGHDIHTSILLGVVEILKKYEHKLNSLIKIIFQPGEEVLPGGAKLLIEKGILENPKPEAIFGQHINPEENTGVISINKGAFFASTDELYITIYGNSGHAAQPHLSNDAILAASQIILYFQSIITKFRDPLYPAVLSITSINGGTATNVFPDKVELKGTLRTFDNDLREKIHIQIKNGVNNIAEIYNCKNEVKILKGYPPLINDEILTNFVITNSKEILGENYLKIIKPKMFAEDFAYYSQKIPSVFWFLGVKPTNQEYMPPLHNSKLNPDENAIFNGIYLMTYNVFKYFNIGDL